MSNDRAAQAVTELIRDGGALDYGPDRSRLLLRVLRTLALGHPLSAQQAEAIAVELGIAGDEANQFLRRVTERDNANNIVGAIGLTLRETAHHFSIHGRRMWAWCADDTLFLPRLLDRTATIESPSPLTGETVRLQVSPHRVEEVSTPGAVVSFVIPDPEESELGCVEAIWATFCHHSFFFASREEGARWAGARTDVEILSVAGAFELGQQVASRFIAFE